MKSILDMTIQLRSVAVPVGLASTVKSGAVSFRQLHRDCRNPLQMQLVCPVHGPVPEEERVKGFEVAKGQYVLVEAAELEELAPEADRTIPVLACVAPRELEHLPVLSRYWLLPSTAPIARRPYALLRQALADSGTVALTRFVAFGGEWLAQIAPASDGRVLVLERLAFREDVLPATELGQALAKVEPPSAEEADLAQQLVEQLRPFRLRAAWTTSDHRGRVQQLVEAKLAGEPIVHAPAAGKRGQQQLPPADLTDALRRSITKKPAARDRRPARPRARSSAR